MIANYDDMLKKIDENHKLLESIDTKVHKEDGACVACFSEAVELGFKILTEYRAPIERAIKARGEIRSL